MSRNSNIILLFLISVVAITSLKPSSSDGSQTSDLMTVNGTCNPGTPQNDALPIFQSFKSELSGFISDVIPKERTTTCLPSIVVQIKDPAKIKDIKLLNTMVGLYALEKKDEVKVCSPGHLGCCGEISNSYARCVKELDLKPNSPPMLKAGVALFATQALTHEIGRSSFIVPSSELRSIKLDGDQIYLIWPFPIKSDKSPSNYVFTRLDSDLIQRLMVAVDETSPTFRAFSNTGYPGASAYICGADGIFPRLYLKNSKNAVLKVGTGSATDIRKPADLTYGKTLQVTTMQNDKKDLTALEIIDGINLPLGGENRGLIEFSKSVESQKIQAFACYGQTVSNVINDPTSLRFFNSPSSSIFYFGLIYLNGFTNEFLLLPAGSPATAFNLDTVIDIQKERDEISSKGQSIINKTHAANDGRASLTANSGPERNCPNLCKNGDPKCLLMELADEQRYKGLKGLYSDSMSPRPYTITQARLKELFGDHATSSERSDIYITKDNIYNSGSIPVFISLKINNIFSIQMDFPVLTEGNITNFDGSGMKIDFNNQSRSPKIIFSDEIFNNRFGGNLKSVSVETSNTYFETSNGCLQLPYQKVANSEFDLRAARISRDILGIDMTNIFDLRNVETSCSVSSGQSQSGQCSCLACGSATCCNNPDAFNGVCCNESTWEPAPDGDCRYNLHPECSCRDDNIP